FPLTYSATGLPSGLTMNASTGVIGGTVAYLDSVTSGGVYSVQVAAEDGHGVAASGSFTWTISQAPPTLTHPGAQASTENVPVSFQVAANDPDGYTLTYSATNLPAGLSIDASTGLITGTVPLGTFSSSGGSFASQIQVTDSQGLSATQSFTWDVVE